MLYFSYEDFLVHEIDVNGNVVRLTTISEEEKPIEHCSGGGGGGDNGQTSNSTLLTAAESASQISLDEWADCDAVLAGKLPVAKIDVNVRLVVVAYLLCAHNIT